MQAELPVNGDQTNEFMLIETLHNLLANDSDSNAYTIVNESNKTLNDVCFKAG